MKISQTVCDVTGDYTRTHPLDLRVFTRRCRLDAAGDTDDDFISETITYDLSHMGAVTVLGELARHESEAVRSAIRSLLDSHHEQVAKRIAKEQRA